MAVAAFADQKVIQWNVQRCMGNYMACGTVRKFRPMRFNMALTAFGHNFLIVIFQWVVGVELLVAILAFNLVTVAVLLDFGKNTGMTLGTLGNGQRLRCGYIHICAAGSDVAICRNSRIFSSAYLYT